MPLCPRVAFRDSIRKPPLGNWIVEDFVQVEPGVYTNRIFSLLALERAFDNVFTGAVFYMTPLMHGLFR